MEKTNRVIPHLLQKQIEDFSKSLQLFDEGRLGINELCIKAHSVKGLALFYDIYEIKEILLDIERYLFFARSRENISKIDIVMQLMKRQQEVEECVKSINSNTQIESNGSKICLFRKAKKYVYVINTLNRYEIKNLVAAINEVVLITGVIQRFDKTYISFLSNLSFSNLKVLFSSFDGQIKEFNFKHKFVKMAHKNLISELFDTNNKKTSLKEGDIYVEDFMEGVYQGLLNIASEANVKVKFKYSFNCEIISREVENALTLPLLEILKNAISHNTEVNELLIKLSINVSRHSTVIKIYNNGKKIDSKKIRNMLAKEKIVGKSRIHKLSRKNVTNLIFNSFLTTSNSLTIAGRGVGLFEARRLIENRGGTIEVKNCFKGLEFSIYLPKLEVISRR